VFWVADISIELTEFLNHQRKKMESECRGLSKEFRRGYMKKPTVLEFTLHFTIGSDKGVLDVSATSGTKTVGQSTIEYQANSAWPRMSQADIEAEED
jgi:hypothetical protein